MSIRLLAAVVLCSQAMALPNLCQAAGTIGSGAGSAPVPAARGAAAVALHEAPQPHPSSTAAGLPSVGPSSVGSPSVGPGAFRGVTDCLNAAARLNATLDKCER